MEKTSRESGARTTNSGRLKGLILVALVATVLGVFLMSANAALAKRGQSPYGYDTNACPKASRNCSKVKESSPSYSTYSYSYSGGDDGDSSSGGGSSSQQSAPSSDVWYEY